MLIKTLILQGFQDFSRLFLSIFVNFIKIIPKTHILYERYC